MTRQSPGTKVWLAIPFPLNRFAHGFVLQRGLLGGLLLQVVFNGSNPRSSAPYSRPGGVGKGLGADQGFRCLLNIYSL